jgi:hypothetical protein
MSRPTTAGRPVRAAGAAPAAAADNDWKKIAQGVLRSVALFAGVQFGMSWDSLGIICD